MPSTKISIPLGGYSQTPDERVGAPRITRAVNMRMASPGRLEQSPGFVTVSQTYEGLVNGEALLDGVVPQGGAFHLVYEIPESTTWGAAVYVERQVNSGLTSMWSPAKRDTENMPGHVIIDEAPTVTPIFTDASYTHGACGVLSTGSERYVVFGEALSSASSISAFQWSMINYAFVQLADAGCEVVYRGRIIGGLAAGSRMFATSTENYLVYYLTSTTLRIVKFSNGSINPITIRDLTGAVACGSQTQLAMCENKVTQRLLVVDAQNHYWFIDTSNGTLLHAGLLSPGRIATGGTQAVCGCGNDNRYFYAAWDGTDWFFTAYTITNTTASISTTAHTIVPSGLLMFPTGAIAQALMVGYHMPDDTMGAYVTVFLGAAARSATAAQARSGVTYSIVELAGSGAANVGSVVLDMHDAVPATPPTLVADVTIPYFFSWAYQTQQRSIRALTKISAQDRIAYGLNYTYSESTATAFLGGAIANMPRESQLGTVNPALFSTRLAPIENGVAREGYLLAVLGQKSASSDLTNVYLVTQATGARNYYQLRKPLASLQQANSPNGAVMSGALPVVINQLVTGTGMQYTPTKLAATDLGSGGGGPGAGTYLYVIVAEWRDERGNIGRGPVSDVSSVTMASTNKIKLDFRCESLEFWQESAAGIAIYRTTAGGSTFYRLKYFDMSSGTTTTQDSTTDALLISQEILYTQGARGALSGMLQWWGCPPCRCLWAGSERMIAGGLENSVQARVSNIYFPGEVISWPLHAAFTIVVLEPITAVAVVDSAYLVFSRNKIWVTVGAGPDAFGIGAFETPKLLSANVGAHSQRSVVETPDGIMFQADDGQIYLLQRGSYQITRKSAAIDASIGAVPSPLASFPAQSSLDNAIIANWVVGAVYDAQQREVWFAESSERCWVYQPEFDFWRAEQMPDIPPGSGFAQLSLGRSRTAAGRQAITPSFTVTNSSGTRLIRCARDGETNLYRDAGGNYRPGFVFTNDIDIGSGRFKRARVRTWKEVDRTGLTDGKLPGGVLSIWFDGRRQELSADESLVFAENSTSAGDDKNFLDIELIPGRQKCNQLRLCWQITGVTTAPATNDNYLSVSITDFELEVVPYDHGPVRRKATGNWRAG